MKHKHFRTVVIFVVVAIAFLVYIVGVVRQGAGSTQSRASRSETLTPGDDALSLEQDLNKLQQDPEPGVEQELNAIQ